MHTGPRAKDVAWRRLFVSTLAAAYDWNACCLRCSPHPLSIWRVPWHLYPRGNGSSPLSQMPRIGVLAASALNDRPPTPAVQALGDGLRAISFPQGERGWARGRIHNGRCAAMVELSFCLARSRWPFAFNLSPSTKTAFALALCCDENPLIA